MKQDVRARAPPVFPKPVCTKGEVVIEPGVGFVLVSQSSCRRYFCPENSASVATHFSGEVRKVFILEEPALDEGDGELMCSVVFEGNLYYYCPSRPLALKTSRLAVLKLESQWQRCSLGEFTGEDPIKEIASLQLLQENGVRWGGHPGVEQLYEALSDNTTIYKISEWYSGGELFDHAPLSEEVARPIFAALLDAVSFIHAQGVCHRDISLENVLMDTSPRSNPSIRNNSVSSVGSIGSVSSVASDETEPDSEEDCISSGGPDIDGAGRRGAAAAGEWIGTPRLCDFGMSVRIPTTKAGERALLTPQGRCGKSTCVAPEVFYDQVFDAHAVDTWSIGTTLFMALLGVQPWEEIGDFKFQAIAEGKNLDIVLQGWNLRDSVSDEALDLLQSMLTADPEERLSDIKSILAHPWFQAGGSH